jgi:hypothetical protein
MICREFGEMVFYHNRVGWTYDEKIHQMNLWVKKFQTKILPGLFFTKDDVTELLDQLSPEGLGLDT